MTVRADLHAHSCLSPCGDLEMSPRAIARIASSVGLSLIALTDHNSARNAPAFAAACHEYAMEGVYGCEVTTSEETHVLALFDRVDVAVDFGELIYATLPDVPHDPERFGDQPVVDEHEVIVEFLGKSLLGASALDLAAVRDEVRRRKGLFIPAHVDRAAFSVWSQLGVLPPGEYDALEIVDARQSRINTGTATLVCGSDAHTPDEIGSRWIEFDAARPTFDSLRVALHDATVRCHGGTFSA